MFNHTFNACWILLHSFIKHVRSLVCYAMAPSPLPRAGGASSTCNIFDLTRKKLETGIWINIVLKYSNVFFYFILYFHDNDLYIINSKCFTYIVNIKVSRTKNLTSTQHNTTYVYVTNF